MNNVIQDRNAEFWFNQRKLEIWLQLNFLHRGTCKRGIVPECDYKIIKSRAGFNIERCKELEKDA
jgi:hypothetical protein